MRGAFKRLAGHGSNGEQELSNVNDYEDSTTASESGETKLQLLQFDGSESLWQQAWNQAKKDPNCQLPVEWHLDSLKANHEAEQVAREARARAEDTSKNEQTIGSGTHTYRQVYGNIANYAQKFQSVGDLLVQADPGYATLPWTLVRFCISIAASEDETYHRMLDGTGYVSQLIVQYSVIEKTYAQVDSDLATEVRKTLFNLYLGILRFQVFAIRYFDQDEKIYRTRKGISPVSAADIKAQLEVIKTTRDQADHCLILVHSDVTKRGIEDISESLDANQKEILDITRDGILALARRTAKSFEDQSALIEGKFTEIKDRDRERDQAILELWHEPLSELSNELQKQQIHREEQELRDIRQWLSRAEPEANYQEARVKRHLEGLGGWLLEHPRFQDWEQSSKSSILWMYGFAGTGKTGLVCRAIDHLRKVAEQINSRVAFFFCSSDQGNSGRQELGSRSDPEEALRSVVSRLSTSAGTRSVAAIVQEKYKKFGPGSDQARPLSYHDCVEIIRRLAKDMPITIILDAFDELDHNKSPLFLNQLRSIISQSPERVKILISTRSFPAIENELNPDDGIEVTIENNGRDVRAFIENTLDTQIKRGNLLQGRVSDQLKTEIKDTLTHRARNMFLYASLLLNQICDPNSNDDEVDVRKKLEKLPNSITAVYDGVMEQLRDNNDDLSRTRRIAQETFKWLLRAQTMLLSDFLVEAISSIEGPTNDIEIQRACRTLVVKTQVSDRDVFEFAHYSVREHVSKMEDYSPSKCHLVALKACLRTLNTTFEASNSKSEVSESQKLFCDYAMLYWPLHYEGIGRSDMTDNAGEINSILRTFLIRGRSKTNKYAQWFPKAQDLVKKLRDNETFTRKLAQLQTPPPEAPTALFAACVFGIDDLIGQYGREPGGLNKTNAHGQTALCLAIENSKIEVVKALLSRRIPADINLLNVKAVQQFEDYDQAKPPEILLYASALQCAAVTGSLDIAEYLIEEGANIDLVAGYYGSPLQGAALEGHSEIVSLLLKHGAEPNSQGGFHGNALQAAATKGRLEIINLLLENKPPALVDTPGGHYGSALMAAICSGNADVVWALLEERAPPNLASKKHGMPLEMAASMGQNFREIVSLLLDVHAEAVWSQKGQSFHLLHKAARYNMLDLAEHCLQKGCNINMVTKDGPAYQRRFGDFPNEMTPLGYACAEGHVEMVQMLLSRGAATGEGRDPSAVLWIASYQGHSDVVTLLLNHSKAKHTAEEITRFTNQRPNPKAGHSTMWAAASSGSADAVNALIDHGVEYRANWFGATPLFATATFGCTEVCRRLIELHDGKRIDIRLNQPQRNGRTALHEAIGKNRPEILRMLLEAGADFMVKDNLKQTLLHEACAQENISLLSSLVEWAKTRLSPAAFLTFINSQKDSERTPLVFAAQRNYVQHIELLMDHGADWMIPGIDGDIPLNWASKSGHDDSVKALLNRSREINTEAQSFAEHLNHQTKDKLTPISEAARENRISTMQILLDYGANYTIEKRHKRTSLHSSSWRGYRDIVQLLLQKISKELDEGRRKAFIDQRNDEGKTALFDAADAGHPKIVKILLRCGASYDITNNGDSTPLQRACHKGRREVVVELLAHASQAADKKRFHEFLNHTNGLGKTALMDAAETNRELIVKMLLDHGADYSIVNKRTQFTALHHCAYRNHMGPVRSLLENASEDRTENGQKFKRFLNQRGENGASALIDAAHAGHTDIALYLLDFGPEYHTFDSKGHTSLHFAISRSDTRLALALLKYAEDDKDRARFKRFVNAKQNDGKTALEVAKEKKSEAVVRALVETGILEE